LASAAATKIPSPEVTKIAPYTPAGAKMLTEWKIMSAP
jgi:hypothetical protein